MIKKYQIHQIIAIVLIIIATTMLDGIWYEPIDLYGNKVSLRYNSSPLGITEFTEGTIYTLIYKYQGWNGYMNEETYAAVEKINLAMDFLPIMKMINMIAIVAMLFKLSPVIVYLPGMAYVGFWYLVYSSEVIDTILYMAKYWGAIESGIQLTFSMEKLIALICIFSAAVLYSLGYKKLKANKAEIRINKEKVQKVKEVTKNVSVYAIIKGKKWIERVGDKVKVFIEESNENMKETITEKEISICNACGHKSVKEAKFCSKCGKAMVVVKEPKDE